MGDLLHQSARQLVEILGIGQLDKDGKIRSVLVEAINSTLDDSSFWSITPQQLLAERRVQPYTPPEEPMGPPDESVEDFLSAAFS